MFWSWHDWDRLASPSLGIWGMRMKIEGMMRSARGKDKLSQYFVLRVETVELRRNRPAAWRDANVQPVGTKLRDRSSQHADDESRRQLGQ